MTLTRVPHSLLLFGGSGPSARCYNDLQARPWLSHSKAKPDHSKCWADASASCTRIYTCSCAVRACALCRCATGCCPCVLGLWCRCSTSGHCPGSSPMRLTPPPLLMPVVTRSTSNPSPQALRVAAAVARSGVMQAAAHPEKPSWRECRRTTRSPMDMRAAKGITRVILLQLRMSHVTQYKPLCLMLLYCLWLWVGPGNPNSDSSAAPVLVLGPGPGRRAGHTATIAHRRLFVFGGSYGGDYLNDTHILDTGHSPLYHTTPP